MQVHRDAIMISTKMKDGISSMATPIDKKSLQRFIGSVEWLSRFIEHLAEDAAPLLDLCGNQPWRWTDACQIAFDTIKAKIAAALPLTVIREDDLAPADSEPVHFNQPPPASTKVVNPAAGNYIFLQCDASSTGTSANLTYGTNWWLARPVSHHSHKLSGAQYNYRTHEQELLAIYEGFQKFEGKLLGRKVIVLTDNKSLESFLQSKNLTPRQARVYEYLSQFNFVIKYIKGEFNFVADMLSRQFEGQPKASTPSDPTLRDLDGQRPSPTSSQPSAYHDRFAQQYENLTAALRERSARAVRPPSRFDDTHHSAAPARVPRRPKQAPAIPPIVPARVMPVRAAPPTPSARVQAIPPPARPHQRQAKKQTDAQRDAILTRREAEQSKVSDAPIVDVDETFESDMRETIRLGYLEDRWFSKIVSDSKAFQPLYEMDPHGLLWQNDPTYGKRLCVPKVLHRKREVREIFLEHMHEVTGHVSAAKLISYAQTQFWWPSISSDIIAYCRSCPSCQASKKTTQLPPGKLHQLPVPTRPYEMLGIDFQGPFPMARTASGQEVDFVCNWIDHFSSEVISIPCNQRITGRDCAEMFFEHVFPHWGVPESISSDRDTRFRTDLWRDLFRGLGTTLMMSSSYHPQSNPKTERMHRDMNQIFRQVVDEWQSNWPSQLPFVVFALNSMTSASTGFSPFEISRIVIPRAIPSWASAPSTSSASELIADAQLRLSKARDNILKARIGQAFYANKARRYDEDKGEKIVVGEQYWLSTKNFNVVPNRSRKWTPPYTGPFTLLAFDPITSSFTLDLPDRYTRRGISNTFHGSQLKKFVSNDSLRFPNRLSNPVPVFPIDSVDQSTMGFTVVKGHYPRMGLDGKEHLMLSCKIGALGTAEIEATDSLITNLPTFKDANGLTASILDMYMLSQGVTDLAGLAKVPFSPDIRQVQSGSVDGLFAIDRSSRSLSSRSSPSRSSVPRTTLTSCLRPVPSRSALASLVRSSTSRTPPAPRPSPPDSSSRTLTRVRAGTATSSSYVLPHFFESPTVYSVTEDVRETDHTRVPFHADNAVARRSRNKVSTLVLRQRLARDKANKGFLYPRIQ
jgi:hypothetical protein